MSEIDNNWIYEKNDFIGDFNDIRAKELAIAAAPYVLGYEIEINPEQDGKGADLRAKHDHTIHIEVEVSHAIGNFWDDDYYSTLSGLPFRTLNMPKRKERYYLPEYYVGKGKNRRLIDNRQSMYKTIFFRFVWDGRQLMVVKPEVVHNPEKLHRSIFKPNTSNSTEKWMCFKKEDIETYNRQINEAYIIDSDPNGTYVPLTSDERKMQEREVAADIARLKAEKAKREHESAERKASEEKERQRLGKKLNMVERREIAKSTVLMFQSTLEKSKLDALEIPQYESQKEEYFKNHPILSK